ncbi:MAG: 1-acyl-sn-glycerol-3-phosphate acyltransferase [Chitinophagaceae bacterium]|jgi:1-acyl-sn-glycerol-3-phosphate acyltransferase|nr:1-acyl-sn-glycerol-3-phosphate acyltransferase [Chitinophagaceae bacterium]MBK7679480.1 1-acyl-sn-glycerol-3-phosphate acyltransferase [Chitinophagaceae bacterium]MBK8299171.1 1-acyl-sn-glycerol-3-phosphate acyltransferase [Chitinophagaceae bacterium]MBK9463222.1 1-acyl-sn-glycerol-3-phosphate acyltransferase [Chitinophagaceae bacterium]MBK9659648.1 1-acyl-sn-glycerol-3-phosphate acyltransferase [Chitinophagaceae bacterium]
MKVAKTIFGGIWALWGLISFVLTFLIIFIPSMIPYLVPDPKGQDLFIRISRIWMTVWLYMVGCPLKVSGKENFAKGTSYIVTCNHNSMLDIPISCPFIPGGNKTIAKKSFVKVPLFGWFYRKGAVLVDRKSEISRRKSFEEMKKVLAMGMHMSVYPEGTRNRTDEPLKKFYDGAFKLAVDTNTAVIPAVIFNTKKALPVHKPFYFIPHRLRMDFLEPIPVEGQTTEQLRDKVFQVMKDHYLKYNR